MRAIRVGTIFLLLGTTACVLGEPNVYALPQAEVVDRLARADLTTADSGPFGRLGLQANRRGADKVVWTASGSHATRRCEIVVEAVDAASSRLNVSCGGASAGSGAAAGLEMSHTRKNVIEYIDATLEGRPYDHRLAMGATAAGWPEDPAGPSGGYVEAVGQAVAMEQEMRSLDAQARQQAATTQARRGGWAPSSEGWGKSN